MPKALIKLGNITRRYASKNAKSTMGVNEYNSIEKNYRILSSVTSKADSTNSSKYNLHTITLSARKILESLADSNTANKYAHIFIYGVVNFTSCIPAVLATYGWE